MRHELNTLRRLSARQWGVLIEAVLYLSVSAVAIAFLPFASLARLASRHGGQRMIDPDQQRVVEIGRIVSSVARYLPFRAKCFECGLAAQWMLRRRGIASTLFYGAALETDGKLAAHVWVRASDLDVVGCANAADYALLARFPAEPDQPATSPIESNRPPFI